MTLVEVLVAMTLVAILAGIAGRGLIAVAEGQQRLEAERRRWDELAAFFARFGDGVGQAVPQPLWQADAEGRSLVYWRLAAAGARREAWRLWQGRVELAQGEVPEWLPALAGVRRLGWRHLDHQGQWRAAWTGGGLPRAVVLSLELDDGRRLERFFATP
jgi:prepilin-type N-terminal cleavage/methylation domain-containing protein